MLGYGESGKSTLIGVLISGQNDDGKGLARVHVHKHYSEILDGKTTSMYQHILGFNSSGEVTNLNKFGNMSWPEIMEDSSKVINFIDVGGDEKYAKTIIRGLCVNYPDYALIVVDAFQCQNNNFEFPKPVLDNFRIALQFEEPLIIVLTKIDLVPDADILEDIIFELRK
jgi:elongation factor 1-alpha